MLCAFVGLLAACQPATAQRASSGEARELVVVLHGMGRTSFSMAPMQEALEAAGYDVLNIGYSSYCCSIAELGAAVRRELDEKRRPEHRTVHFVGHSLGGIIARWILAQDDRPVGVGRLVMLAPPNQGSRSADRYAGLVGWLLEPIDELRTDSSATVRKLPAPRGVEFGIIAGRRDGKLTESQTHLDGEAGHVSVDGFHTFLMRKPEVHGLTVAFLRDGRFPAQAAAAATP
jgi:triacylglycerol lipase